MENTLFIVLKVILYRNKLLLYDRIVFKVGDIYMDYIKQFIKNLDPILNEIGGNIYLVGGYIRDKLISYRNKPKDADFIYDGNIEKLIKRLEKLEYKFFPIKKSAGIYRCLLDENIIDISEIKGNSIEEDLSKRDFTVNAIAMKVLQNKIIDPFYGRRAIKNKIIKSVSKESFNNDPIRILRGIRLYLTLGMHFNKETEDMLVKEAYKISEAPNERILSELMTMIENDTEGKVFELLDTFSVLKYLIPYTEELKTIGKCKYHVEDVFTHSNLTYKVFKDIVKQRINIKGIDLIEFNSKIGEFSIREYIALVCFLHDIGKYKAYTKNSDGSISFSGHEEIGSQICKAICENLRFPKKASKFVEDIVGAHMYPLKYFKDTADNKRKNYYKFFSRYDKLSKVILIVSFCDNYATRMLLDKENEKEKYKRFVEDMLHEYDVYAEIKNNKIIDGNYIEDILGETGSIVGDVIKNMDEFRYLKRINTKEEAIEYVKKIKLARL